MRPLFALLLLLAATLASAQQSKVLLVPFEIQSVPKYTEATAEEAREQVYEAAWKVLGEAYASKGHVWASPKSVAQAMQRLPFDAGRSKDRELDSLLALGHTMGCDVVIVVVVEKLEQKNRGTRDILSNAGKPASESKARVRVWAADVREGTLRSVGKDVLEGASTGQFIGTTKRDEMSGNPEDKTVFIRLENRKRSEGYGRAIADAVKKALGEWLQEPKSL